ncbi:hypothetical protein [Pseudomonas indica]|uniref:Uncharacterized protein n=1 Tax=Pseudomonas indica TaxID=137658 RepID=A0A1G8V6F5_9PSED|nr:hypothetical protein [Pseudomonas indica]SDJ61631.1 hypothetical protein SAMN05216186_102114 [Pseudomonas indica]
MKPAAIDLEIIPGTTYRDTVRLMQPAYAYRPITAAAGAPLRLTVPGHGLDTAWAVWARGVVGMPDLNREPRRQAPHRATVIDPDTLEINDLSATGLAPSGGELVYLLPVDLTGAGVVMTFARGSVVVLTLTLGDGLTEVGPGSIERALTPAQSALLRTGDTYVMDVQFVNGDVIRYYQGRAL